MTKALPYLLLIIPGLNVGWIAGHSLPGWFGALKTGGRPPNAQPAAAAASGNAMVNGAAEILTVPSGDTRLTKLAKFLPRASAAELEELARAFCANAEDARQGMGIRLILTRWAEVDAAQALAFCRTVEPLSHERAWLVKNALEAWARVDPAGALTMIRDDAEKANRMAVLKVISSTDPGLAVEIAMANGKAWFGVERETEWDDIVSQIARNFPEKAAELGYGGYTPRHS